MPIRAQLDTSMYNRTRRSQPSIGEVFGAVQGIQGMVGTARQRKKEDELEADDRFLNDVYARSFAGWDGQDPADFQRRNNAAIQEVTKGRSNLYGKAIGISSTLEQALQTSTKGYQEIAGKEMENKEKQIKFEREMFNFSKDQQDYLGNQFALVAEGKQSYSDAINKIKLRNIKTNIPIPTEEQFYQNPEAWYDVLLSHDRRMKEMENVLTQKEKALNIKKLEQDVEWGPKLNQALIGARNRQGTGGAGAAGGGTGLSDIDMINAQKLAREIGGVRGMKAVLPQITRAMQSGMTIDNIRDQMRYSQQSGDFSGAAREGMQQLFSGKSGKAVDAAFDAFDDLLATGDKNAIASYLRRTAQNTAGQQEAAQIRGTERILNFIDEIKTDLDNYEANGGNTNIFSGTAEDFRKKLGYVKDTEMRKMAEKIHAAIMKYRRSMSGAAFSVPESKEYADIFPSIKRTGNLNSASINALKDVFSGDLETFYRISLGDNAYNTFIAGGTGGGGGAGGGNVIKSKSGNVYNLD
jgi:hypothetical protein